MCKCLKCVSVCSVQVSAVLYVSVSSAQCNFQCKCLLLNVSLAAFFDQTLPSDCQCPWLLVLASFVVCGVLLGVLLWCGLAWLSCLLLRSILVCCVLFLLCLVLAVSCCCCSVLLFVAVLCLVGCSPLSWHPLSYVSCLLFLLCLLPLCCCAVSCSFCFAVSGFVVRVCCVLMLCVDVVC